MKIRYLSLIKQGVRGSLFLLLFFGIGGVSWGKSHTYWLKNGLQVIQTHRPKASLSTVLLMVRAGTVYDTDSTQGLSRMVQSILFRQNLRCPDVQRTIDSFGGLYRTDIQPDFSWFSTTVINAFLDSILDVYAVTVKDPLFTDSLVSVVSTYIRKTIEKERTDPGMMIRSEFLKLLYQNHPYRFLSHGGTLSNDAMTLDRLLMHFRTLYTPDNMVLIVSSGSDPSDVRRKIRNAFGSLPRSVEKIPVRQPEREQTEPREKVLTHSLAENVAFLSVGWQAPSVKNPDTYAMDMLVACLGYGEGSRLNTQIQSRLKGVYLIGAEYRTPMEPGYLVIHAICEPSVIDTVKERILTEIGILRKDPILAKEVNRAKVYFDFYVYDLTEDTFGDAYNYGYWSAIDRFQTADNYLPSIHRVTAADMQRVASAYLKENSTTTIRIIPAR